MRGFFQIPRVADMRNEAFVRGVLPIPRVENTETKLSCEASFIFQELKIWTSVFNAAVPMQKVSQHMQSTTAQRLRSGLCSLRHMPTEHNDLCTVLVAGANWTLWSLSYVHWSTCQLDTMISALSYLQVPTGHNDLWALKTIRNSEFLYKTSFD